MVIEGWEWNTLPILIMATWLLSHARWQFQVQYPYFLQQDLVCLYQSKQLTAAWPSQCLIIGIMNGHTRLRLEFGVSVCHHKLFLSHEWGQMWLDPHPLFTPRSSVFVPIQAIDSSLTLPMSHDKYNKCLDNVEILILCLNWSPQAVFESRVGINVARF